MSTTQRLPNIGETVYYWRFREFTLDAVRSGVVVELSVPDDPRFGLGYVVVRVRPKGASEGSLTIHGANPIVQNDRDDWFFSEAECKRYIQSEIDRRNVAIAKYP